MTVRISKAGRESCSDTQREQREVFDEASIIALARTAAESHETISGEQDAVIDALREEIERHTLAIEHLSEGVSYYGKDGRLILCNARYAEIYRLDPEAVRPGMSLREVVELRTAAGTSPTDADDYLALCDEIDAGRAPNNWTAALADGRRIDIRHHALPGGGWISTHEDVTEASRTVANERITLQTLVDWVPDNLWVKDVDSRFVIANQATARRMGRTLDEVIGKSDLELVDAELAAGFYADEQRVVETGQPMIDKEEYIVDEHGQRTWILTSKIPLRNDEDKIIGLVGISRDISERRRADILRDSQARCSRTSPSTPRSKRCSRTSSGWSRCRSPAPTARSSSPNTTACCCARAPRPTSPPPSC